MAKSYRLFRPEAQAAKRIQLVSHIRLDSPPHANWTVTLLVVTAIGGLGFALSAQIPRKETTRGYLLPTAGIARLYAPRSGIVDAIQVLDGDEVEAGARIATIRGAQNLESGGDVEAAVIQSFDEQMHLVGLQVEEEKGRTTLLDQEAESRSTSLKEEIKQITAQRDILNQRLSIAEGQETRAAELVGKGTSAPVQLETKKLATLDIRQNLALIEQTVDLKRHELDQTDLARTRAKFESANQISKLELQRLDIDRQKAEAEGRRVFAITAPVTGRVYFHNLAIGQAVDPRQPVASILPRGSDLVAELLVPSKAVGFVRPGMEVNIAVDAFPIQRFGVVPARVTKVAFASVAPANLPVQIGIDEPGYQVTAILDRQSIASPYGEGQLRPDMTLTADFILYRRSLLYLIFEPIFAARAHL